MAGNDRESLALARTLGRVLHAFRAATGLGASEMRELVERKTGLAFSAVHMNKWTNANPEGKRRVNPCWIGKGGVGLWELLECLQAWPLFFLTLNEELPYTVAARGPEGLVLRPESARPRLEEPPVAWPVPFEIRQRAFADALHTALRSSHWTFEAMAGHVGGETGKRCKPARLKAMCWRNSKAQAPNPSFFGSSAGVGLYHVMTVLDRWHFLIHEQRYRIARLTSVGTAERPSVDRRRPAVAMGPDLGLAAGAGRELSEAMRMDHSSFAAMGFGHE